MPLNVLVVDDSPVTRKMVRRAVLAAGLALGEVHEAGDGEQALALLAHHPVDLVLADINMPAMTGTELVEQMAALPTLAHVPVVMIASPTTQDRLEHLIRRGAKGYLTKPFRPEELRHLLSEILPAAAVTANG